MAKPVITELDETEVDPSPTNPRKHFDDTELNELGDSIFEQGILQPLLVRPKKRGKGHEIVAGERRYRANKIALARARAAAPADAKKIASLEKLPCIVRDLTDEEAADIQLMENEQRSDLTPLERAAGYRNLINTNPTKFTATVIAQKVGKTATWVWDIMKILDLIPKAKELLEAGKMTVNHAIPIARLTPKQQEKVIDPREGGLFVHDSGFNFEGQHADDEKDPWCDVKARSVRELNAWIAHHIRFDPKKAAAAAPLLFEPVAEAVATAEKLPGRGKKVIPITHDYHVHPDAKDGAERTYGSQSWRRADGSKGTTDGGYNKPPKDSPTCEHSVLGFIVTGRGYGEAFPVCVARDKCKVHFGDVIKEKEKREREKATGSNGAGSNGAGKPHVDKWEEQQKREREERARRELEYDAISRPLKQAAREKIAGLTEKLPGNVWALLLKEMRLPRETKPAKLALVLAKQHATDMMRREWEGALPEQVEWATALGLDVAKIRKEALAPLKAKAEVQTSGAAKTNGSKPVRKALAKKAAKKAARKTVKK